MTRNLVHSLRLLVLLMTITFAAFSSAADEVEATDKDSEEIDHSFFAFKLSGGYFKYDSPLNFKEDFETNILPGWTFYYKDDFFIENTKVGYNLYKDENTFIDFVGLHNFDGLYYHADDTAIEEFFSVNPFLPPEEPQHNAHLSYLAGPEIKRTIDSTIISAGFYTDVSNVHHGQQANFSIQHRILEYKIKLVLEFGAVYKSDQLLEYYYGSDLVGDNINYYTQIDAAYPLLDGLFLVANYKFERLSSKINSSSLTDKKELNSGYIGINWVTYW
ncbi:MipA/OmpV family protein [Thalassotalea crassostreae]|uniref:MipA/OmpV family protein n=1 Tax=Thalassotalea crassostreae TaxID=1763536 RepID=UPI0008A64C7E|nr:MipA/OmpV family protein [Thalassotalea crassostreae]